jgi:hypothetical protein
MDQMWGSLYLNYWPLRMVLVAMGTGAKELYRETLIKSAEGGGEKSLRGHKNKKAIQLL